MGVTSNLGDNTNVGNVELFIDTAYDNVKIVADNITKLLLLESHFSAINGNYLGTSTSELTVRPDTTALQDGDGYFNTTLNLYYVYVDGSWLHQTIFYDQAALTSAVGAGPFNVWVAYAEDAAGTGISTIPSASKKYIGIANNKTTNIIDTSNPGVFSWHSFEGPTGTTGTDGVVGTSAYVHIAYAGSANGAVSFNFTSGDYLGLYTDSTAADSNDYADYNWTRISTPGTAGTDGLPGLIDIELPLTPVNVVATKTAAAVKITWGNPDYSGHWFTKVYKKEWTTHPSYPAFSESFLVNTVQGDYIDLDVDSDTRYLYWLRHVNLNSVASGLYGSLEVTTLLSYAENVDWLTDDNLDPSLQTRINLIDSHLVNPSDGGLLSAFNALDTSVSGLTTSVGTVTTAGNTATSNITSLSGALTALTTVVGDTNAGLYYETGLNTTSGAANTAAVATNLTSIGGLHAQYTVKINNNGHLSGFGLASTTSPYDGAVHSEFAVLADKFLIATPGNTTSVPFLVSGGTVFMNSAYIEDAAITNAKIGNTIQSASWNSSTKAGWQLDKAGNISGKSITMYDASGNVLLSSASGVAADILNGSQLWTEINGSTKPADNATVGATWGSNLSGQPSDTILLNANTTPSDIGYLGALNATYGATWSSNLTGQPSDTALLNSNTTWANVAGTTNAPANNATNTTNTNQLTDGAGLGSSAAWANVTGISNWASLSQITVSNASTYIASAAIVDAQIGNLSAVKITTGSLSAARIAANTIVGNHIAAGTIIADKMAANSITAANGAIANLTVGTLQMANYAVTRQWSASVGVVNLAETNNTYQTIVGVAADTTGDGTLTITAGCGIDCFVYEYDDFYITAYLYANNGSTLLKTAKVYSFNRVDIHSENPNANKGWFTSSIFLEHNMAGVNYSASNQIRLYLRLTRVGSTSAHGQDALPNVFQTNWASIKVLEQKV